MFGLRQKLTFGYLGLLGILLTVGVLSGLSLHRYRATLERIFRDNYDSVVYAQKMKSAVERLDTVTLAAATDASAPAGESADADAADFLANLTAEERNVTLPGESDIVARLRAAWDGAAGERPFPEAVRSVAAAGDREARIARYRAAVLPRARQIEQAGQDVIDINVRNMGFANGQVQRSAAEVARSLYTLIAAGIVFGGLFVTLVARSILGQIGAVTASAREIEHGNLDLIVPVTTRDELGQLAETFNRMATRLRELRRTDRAKLIRTQRTTELALGSLPDGVAIVAPDGHVEIANAAAQKLFGLQPGSPIGQPPAAVGLADLFQRAVTERRAIEAKGYEGAIQIFNGQERFFLPTAVPIFDAERTLAGVTLVLVDVTNLRKLDEMKSGLLAVVSHELKTPLTSMRMATHLLLEERVGPLNPMQAELMTAAKEESDRLCQIIDNLLDMGRIESGREVIERKPVSAETLVRDAVHDVEAAYRDRGVTLRTEVADDLPEVSADAERLQHVFSNLLANALKYSRPGGEVVLTAAPDGHDGDGDGDATAANAPAVRFAVRDGGEGIPAEALPHVFDRFYRVPNQTTHRGVGLGLAIAKEIVATHGGRIWATSVLGSGATVLFTVPAEPAVVEKGRPS